jgi:hypothetical protein
MTQAITVAPSAEGWTVRSETFDSEMFFRSGADAEAAACSLGTRIARVGAPVEIRIFLRGGALGGRYVCTPDRSAPVQSPASFEAPARQRIQGA